MLEFLTIRLRSRVMGDGLFIQAYVQWGARYLAL